MTTPTPKPGPPRFRRRPRLASSEPAKNGMSREELDDLYAKWRAEFVRLSPRVPEDDPR